MSADWDLPEARAQTGKGAAAANRPVASDGLMDPIAFIRFLLRNIVKIGIIALILAVAGLALFSFVPFPYKATATVLVDPRNQRISLQEEVLSPIGADAAILESMVLIMKSDGFLLGVMDKLNLAKDGGASEADRLKTLAAFKKNLSVERRGATYLVEVSYSAPTAEEAARVANIIANSFADTQNGYLNAATENAARALSERLVELRQKLNASEKAVSEFAAAHGILYVDGNSTLDMKQLTELSTQLAVARTATEQARARYQQQVGGSPDALIGENSGEPAQLSYLRQQRAQLMQTLEQQSMTYGARHPRIAQTRQLIAGIEKQIREEREAMIRQLKAALDVAQSQQDKLQADIARLSSGVVMTDAAKVQLEALRREASADREIYERFLSRNKATDELVQLKSENVKVVSPAVPPLRSSKPSNMLLAPVFGLLGAIAGTIAVVVMSGAGFARMTFRRQPVDAQPLAAEPETDTPPEPNAPARAPIPTATNPAPRPERPKPTPSLLMLGAAASGHRAEWPGREAHRNDASDLHTVGRLMREADADDADIYGERRARRLLR